jgi:hypothetical protein
MLNADVSRSVFVKAPDLKSFQRMASSSAAMTASTLTQAVEFQPVKRFDLGGKGAGVVHRGLDEIVEVNRLHVERLAAPELRLISALRSQK